MARLIARGDVGRTYMNIFIVIPFIIICHTVWPYVFVLVYCVIQLKQDKGRMYMDIVIAGPCVIRYLFHITLYGNG